MKKILFGLGNSGPEFVGTRHNVGADMLWQWEKQAGKKELEKVKLIYPRGFMNNSGSVLRDVLRYSPLDVVDVLIIHDDIELPRREAEVAVGGSAKGHNGVRSIYEAVGTQGVARLRIGVGRPPQGVEPKDYVLGKFSQEEKNDLQTIESRVFGLIDEFVLENLKPPSTT